MTDYQRIQQILDSVDTPAGRERVRAFLESVPFPQYGQHPTRRNLLIRIDASGNRTQAVS